MSEAGVGLLDTNVVVHALATDASSSECTAFMRALQAGRVEAAVDPLVVHELTYVLPRIVQQMTRNDVAAFVLDILGWESIRADKSNLVSALERWRDTPGLAFVDAYLAALALRNDIPVFTKNVRDLVPFGVLVPNPLPV